jgi:hypothetical protein
MAHRILYVGSLESGGTSLYRYQALKRLGQIMLPFDVSRYTPSGRILNALRERFPVGPLIRRINTDLVAIVQREQPEVVWLDKPTLLTPETILSIRRRGALTACYLQDNPFGPRNDGCWLQFYRIFKLLDLHCLLRTPDIPRYQQWGLNFIKVQLSYDPAQHFPPPEGWSDKDRDREVSYIGSPYEERPQFLRQLIEVHKLPVTISGPRWEKFLRPAEYRRLMRGGMLKEAAYREGIWKSRINLAFLTHLNQEDVAHKAFEIAACQGFLLALRTAGHRLCFEEGKEAEFFSSVEECAAKIRYYLAHSAEREQIARRGCERAHRSGYDNDSQLAPVLQRLAEMRCGLSPRTARVSAPMTLSQNMELGVDDPPFIA